MKMSRKPWHWNKILYSVSSDAS